MLTGKDRHDGTKWLKTYAHNDTRLSSKGYKVWSEMMRRCKEGGAEQRKRPTYIGCTVSDEFSDFQKFMDWYTSQVGYGIPKYELDKDILGGDNKRYSRETCALIPCGLNSFLTDCGSLRGKYPQGIHLEPDTNKYKVQISLDNKKISVARCSDLDEARLKYKQAKEAAARAWYAKFERGELQVDTRVIEKLKNWTYVCKWVAA